MRLYQTYLLAITKKETVALSTNQIHASSLAILHYPTMQPLIQYERPGAYPADIPEEG